MSPNYWNIKCPYRYKYQLEAWAVLYKGLTRSQARKLTKKQLYAMWYKG